MRVRSRVRRPQRMVLFLALFSSTPSVGVAGEWNGGPATGVAGGEAGIVLVQCPPAPRRKWSYEPMRSVFRRLSWRCNSHHGHLLHQSVEPYWLPNGGYHETIWRRDVICEPQVTCPCPTTLNGIEEEPELAPPSAAPALEAPEPATIPQEAPAENQYSPAVQPRAAEEVLITPSPRRF